jgi:GalNAc-alpha-(1->4)-GalNAc-alpha-(1->3)-diNAcBac-PP-undecaprenol alpha-1,4-N-acetyl-D-galactosaminyltransferase
MKIIYLQVCHKASGIEKRYFNLYKYLNESKSEAIVTIVLSRTFLDICPLFELKNKKINIVKYGLKWKNPSRIARYIDYISLFFVLITNFSRYDIAHFVTSSSLLFRHFVISSKKVFSLVNSSSGAYEQHRATLISIMKNKFFLSCLDENISKFAKELYPDNADRVFLAPCSFIDYNGTVLHNIKKDKIITFAGSLTAYKGVLVLLDSINSILSANKDLKIYILGTGPLHNVVKEFIIKHKLNDKVFLLFLKDPKTILKKSLIFLSLQRDENYPSQSLLEAMACSNAIVATNVGLTYKLVDSSVGMLIGRNSSDLVSAVNLLLSEPGRLKCMGRRAREKVLAEHSVNRFMDYLMNIYNK